MTLEIEEDNTVKIEPYTEDTKTLEIEQLTPINNSESKFIYQNIYD